jgi:hypothetical protein
VYSYPPVAQVISTQFPPIWQPASVLASDSAAQAMWANISGSIPNIAPKGQLNGSTIGVAYNGAADPDCCEYYTFPAVTSDVGIAWRVFLFPWTRL